MSRHHRWLSYPDEVAVFNEFMLACKKAAHGMGPFPTADDLLAVEQVVRPLIEKCQDHPPGFFSRKAIH